MSATGSRIKCEVKRSREKLCKHKRRRLSSSHGDSNEQPVRDSSVASASSGPISQRESVTERNTLVDDQRPSCDHGDLELELDKARAEIVELRQQLAEKSRRIPSGLGFPNANINSNDNDDISDQMENLVNTRDEVNHHLVKDFFGDVLKEVSSLGRDLDLKTNRELVEFRDRLLARSREANQCWIPDGSRYEKVDAKRLKSAEGIIQGYVKKTEAILCEDRQRFLCYCAELASYRDDEILYDDAASSPSPNGKEAEDSILEELRKRIIFEDIPEDSESDCEDHSGVKCHEVDQPYSPSDDKCPELVQPYSPSDIVYSLEDVQVDQIPLPSPPPPPITLEKEQILIQSRSSDKTKRRTSNTKLISGSRSKSQSIAIPSRRSSTSKLVLAPNDDKTTLSPTIPREIHFSALLDASIYESMNGISPPTSPTPDNSRSINSAPNQIPRSIYNTGTSTPNQSRSTRGDKPSQTQSIYYTNKPSLTQGIRSNMPSLTQSICTYVPNLNQNTYTNKRSLTQSTCTKVPNLTQSTCSIIPSLTQSTCTNIPNLPQGTCRNIPSQTQSTRNNIANVPQSTYTNNPSQTQNTYYSNNPNPTVSSYMEQRAGSNFHPLMSSTLGQYAGYSSMSAGPFWPQSLGVGSGSNDYNRGQFLQFGPNSSSFLSDYSRREPSSYGHRPRYYY